MARRSAVFEEFDTQDGDIESYLHRIDQYFIAMDISDTEETAAKRRAILLSSVGTNVYKTLRDLSYPQRPTGKTSYN